MKCNICQGEDIRKTDVKEKINIGTDIIYIPINIPVCTTCGERYYDRRTFRYLGNEEQRLKEAKARVDAKAKAEAEAKASAGSESNVSAKTEAVAEKEGYTLSSIVQKNEKSGKLQENIKEILVKAHNELLAIKGNLISSARGREIKTILVTSSKLAEGKTISAINLAFGLSETNDKVALLDVNLHNPCLHKIFNVSNSPGLSDFLMSNNGFNEKFLRGTEYRRLSVMPCGTKTEYLVDLYKTETFKGKLDSIKQNFDYVILDGPSILSSSDVQLIASNVDGIIIVVECEKTKWEVVQQAKAKLDNVNGNILGIVMNKRQYYIPEKFY